jgi:hypothetical protein
MKACKAVLLVGGAAWALTIGSPDAARAAGVAHIVVHNGSGQGDDAQTNPPPVPQDYQDLVDTLGTSKIQLPPDAAAALKKVQATQAQSQADKSKKSGAKTTKPGSTTSISPMPNSDSNYLSDHLNWDSPIHVYAMDSTGGVDLDTPYCLNAGVKVIGMDSSYTSATKTDASADADSTDGKKSTTAPAANYLPVKLDMRGGLFYQPQPSGTVTANVQASGDSAKFCASSDTTNALSIGETDEFYVDADDLGAANREGWDYGTLVIPFKYQVTGKNALQSSASLGAYLGYRFSWRLMGWTVRPVAFAGLSEIPTSQATNNGKTTSQTVAGLSYGLGLVGTVKDSFNVGLVVGFDHVNSVQAYPYQDKPWISLAIGYSFTK